METWNCTYCQLILCAKFQNSRTTSSVKKVCDTENWSPDSPVCTCLPLLSGRVNCHSPTQPKLNSTWVGWTTLLPSYPPTPPPQAFKALAGSPGRWFSDVNLNSTQLEKLWRNKLGSPDPPPPKKTLTINRVNKNSISSRHPRMLKFNMQAYFNQSKRNVSFYKPPTACWTRCQWSRILI